MAVNIIIKQDNEKEKQISIEKIIELTNLYYGTKDGDFRIMPNEIGDETYLFDVNKLARGIKVKINNSDISLDLSMPTTPSEIELFYDTVEDICEELGTKEYLKDEKNATLDDNEKFVEEGKDLSLAGLNKIAEGIKQGKIESIDVFGICNPISLGEKEMAAIDGNLEKFEELLHNLQKEDWYYAIPRVFKVNDESLIGVYTVPPDFPCILPVKPYLANTKTNAIKQWYMLYEEKMIDYNEFITKVKDKQYYDAKHLVITPKKDEFK